MESALKSKSTTCPTASSPTKLQSLRPESPHLMSTRRLTVEETYPELFLPASNIDPRTRTRTVPMQVLNLGFPRTGTMSMQTALNTLGYTCYHSVQFFSNVRDCAMWNEAMDAKFRNRGRRFTRADWDQLLGHCSAVSADPPAIAFAEDLITAYPDAKVILVERDIESWYKSFDANVIGPMWGKLINLVAACDPFFVGPIAVCHHRWARWWMGATGKRDMQAKARDKYREHYAMVRRVTPKDMLLEYQLRDGWEPLCEFLGKEVPHLPFPNVNDQAVHEEQLAVIMKRGLRNMLRRVINLVAPLLIIAVAWWLLKDRFQVVSHK